MLYAVLGPLEVSDGERSVTIAGQKERILLAVLLASHGTVVQADALIGALWGSAPPKSSARTLAAYVTRLRGILEPGHDDRHKPTVIRTAGSGWVLDVLSLIHI